MRWSVYFDFKINFCINAKTSSAKLNVTKRVSFAQFSSNLRPYVLDIRMCGKNKIKTKICTRNTLRSNKRKKEKKKKKNRRKSKRKRYIKLDNVLSNLILFHFHVCKFSSQANFWPLNKTWYPSRLSANRLYTVCSFVSPLISDHRNSDKTTTRSIPLYFFCWFHSLFSIILSWLLISLLFAFYSCLLCLLFK